MVAFQRGEGLALDVFWNSSIIRCRHLAESITATAEEYQKLREILRLTWERMKIIAAIVGDVEGRVMAILFYFTILVPFGLGSRLLSDPLRLKVNSQHVQWVERAPVENELDAARQQG